MRNNVQMNLNRAAWIGLLLLLGIMVSCQGMTAKQTADVAVDLLRVGMTVAELVADMGTPESVSTETPKDMDGQAETVWRYPAATIRSVNGIVTNIQKRARGEARSIRTNDHGGDEGILAARVAPAMGRITGASCLSCHGSGGAACPT